MPDSSVVVTAVDGVEVGAWAAVLRGLREWRQRWPALYWTHASERDACGALAMWAAREVNEGWEPFGHMAASEEESGPIPQTAAGPAAALLACAPPGVRRMAWLRHCPLLQEDRPVGGADGPAPMNPTASHMLLVSAAPAVPSALFCALQGTGGAPTESLNSVSAPAGPTPQPSAVQRGVAHVLEAVLLPHVVACARRRAEEWAADAPDAGGAALLRAYRDWAAAVLPTTSPVLRDLDALAGALQSTVLFH
eukprot:EG_transcript_14365